MPNLYIALIHYPIVNKEGRLVTTSVTNLDLHDLARTGRTFDVKKVLILTPIEKQREMVNYIWKYWNEGYGASYNPDRKQAFDILQTVENLEQACLTIEKLSGKRPLLVATSARPSVSVLGFSELQQQLKGDGPPVLLCFGTGHGLAPEFFEQVDATLAPIRGRGDFNHLPVRSAVAIILDRLLGREE